MSAGCHGPRARTPNATVITTPYGFRGQRESTTCAGRAADHHLTEVIFDMLDDLEAIDAAGHTQLTTEQVAIQQHTRMAL